MGRQGTEVAVLGQGALREAGGGSVSEMGARTRPEVGWKLARLCAMLGHSYPVRTWEGGNENCDCGADHTYQGCVRCGAAMSEKKRRWAR